PNRRSTGRHRLRHGNDDWSARRTGGDVSTAGDLTGKVAVVTGASRGIGAAIAERFAAAGASVAVTARTTEPTDPRLPGTIHETVDAITAAGGRAVAVPANLAEASDRERLVTTVRDQLGPIDVLV